MSKLTNCKACKKEISKGVKKCPSCGHDQRNFFGKHKILTGLAVVVFLVIMGNMDGNSDTATTVASNNAATTTAPATTTAQPAPTTEPVTTTAPAPTEPARTEPAPTEPAKPKVSTEFISALAKAELYGNTMSMSKAGIYDQLTSEYGEKFSKESAKYAVDHVKIDYKANALKKAETYQKEMSMSPSAVYDQLISEYGEKFTVAEAQYAKDNLK